jgi:hypothetical protein
MLAIILIWIVGALTLGWLGYTHWNSPGSL